MLDICIGPKSTEWHTTHILSARKLSHTHSHTFPGALGSNFLLVIVSWSERASDCVYVFWRLNLKRTHTRSLYMHCLSSWAPFIWQEHKRSYRNTQASNLRRWVPHKKVNGLTPGTCDCKHHNIDWRCAPPNLDEFLVWGARDLLLWKNMGHFPKGAIWIFDIYHTLLCIHTRINYG